MTGPGQTEKRERELRHLADRKGLMTVEVAARAIGVEFREVDGEPLHPFHCGEHMITTEFIGAIAARCRCGMELWDATAAPLNGGLVLHADVLYALGDRIWTVGYVTPEAQR